MNEHGWIDSRVSSPSANAFDKYPAVILCSGIVTFGLGRWMPRDGYTRGDWESDWENTNGNKRSDGQVLYWKEWPSLPSYAKCRDVALTGTGDKLMAEVARLRNELGKSERFQIAGTDREVLLQADIKDLKAEVDRCRERLGPAGMEVLRLANWAHRHAIPALEFYASRTLGIENIKNPDGLIQEGRTARVALENRPVPSLLGDKE